MTERDQEWMERYIYQVVRRLPKDQRDEVGLELRELIGDMMEQADSMVEVLQELGDPEEFAKKYREDSRCLIGPEYYETYRWFMRIVLICTLAATAGAAVLEGIRQGTAGAGGFVNALVRAITYALVDGITNGIISCIGAFGGVTLVFAVLERQKVKLDLREKEKWSVDSLGEKKWTPQNLTGIPHKKAVISRGDSMVSIVFIVIFGVLLIAWPEFFSAVFHAAGGEGEVVVIPLFQLEQWNRVLPIILLGLLAGLVDEILKLIMGFYCRLVMYGNIICGILQIALGVIILKVVPFWNPDVAFQVRVLSEGSIKSEFVVDLLTGWNDAAASNLILAFLVMFTALEIGVTVYRTLRYGTD